MVICLELGADLHMAQLMPLPPTVSCFSKIQIGFTFLVLAHPGSPGKRAVKCVCVCVVQLQCGVRQGGVLSPVLFALYRVGQKTRTVFRLDNFVTVSPRKACCMSKFSKFYQEKRYKTRISVSLNIFLPN